MLKLPCISVVFQVLAQGYPKGKAGAVVEIVRTITQGRIFGDFWLTKPSLSRVSNLVLQVLLLATFQVQL